MKRRLVIKQVLIMAGGLALLPSCFKSAGKSTIQLAHLNIDLDQENLLAEIGETLIPKTDTPGAKELNLHLFVLKMVDDCYEETDEQSFVKGLDQFKDRIYDQNAKTFNQLSAPQRQEALIALEKDKNASAELVSFYKIMKQRTIEGYLNSKYVMTNLVIWELIPGRYNGYFPVKSA